MRREVLVKLIKLEYICSVIIIYYWLCKKINSK